MVLVAELMEVVVDVQSKAVLAVQRLAGDALHTVVENGARSMAAQAVPNVWDCAKLTEADDDALQRIVPTVL